MAKIVCVHGIAQQLSGSESLALEWRVALRDGMRHAGIGEAELPPDETIAVAFFGDLFRGRKSAADGPAELTDIDDGIETGLVVASAKTAGVEEAGDDKGGEAAKSGYAPVWVQNLSQKLLKREFFADLTDRAFVGALQQVRWYLSEPETRQKARERLSRLLSEETRLVIGHSLGSVVAYEVLCRMPPNIAPALITLGSPIGLPNLVFERLDPPPINGQGVCIARRKKPTRSLKRCWPRPDVDLVLRPWMPWLNQCPYSHGSATGGGSRTLIAPS